MRTVAGCRWFFMGMLVGGTGEYKGKQGQHKHGYRCLTVEECFPPGLTPCAPRRFAGGVAENAGLP